MAYDRDVATEVWLRNPQLYIRQAVETDTSWAAWDFGWIQKSRMDPTLFMDLHFPQTDWRSLVIGDEGTVEIRRGYSIDQPYAAYPSWSYGESLKRLEELAKNPVAQRPEMVDNPALHPRLRPVSGQEHRVVLTNLESAQNSTVQQFYLTLAQIQEENPDCIFHLHGAYSYRTMFGLGIASVDVDPRTVASKGKVTLPAGKVVTFEYAIFDYKHWVDLLGFRPTDLKLPTERCKYNIESAKWAAKHFRDAVKFRHRGFSHVDPDNPFHGYTPRNKSIVVRRKGPQEGDKFLCNVCSLQTVCKYFREGAVCIVPESEPVELARFFKSRDAGTIIEGLGTLLAAQTHRLNKALEAEEESGKMHPETTKMINTLFDRAAKLAKLVDPSLGTQPASNGPTLNLTQINASTPQAMMSAITNQLVAQGIPMEQITPDMIYRLLSSPEELKARAIEVGTSEKANP